MSAEQHAPVTSIVKQVTDADLVEERASLKADVEYIQERIEQIDAQLLERLGGQVGTHDVATVAPAVPLNVQEQDSLIGLAASTEHRCICGKKWAR